MARLDPSSTLIVLALREESQGLFESAGIQPFYTGLGQVKAATELTLKLSQSKPTAILNFGTAGSFRFKKGSCVECSAFVQRHINGIGPRYPNLQAAGKLTDLPTAICGTADFIQNEIYKETPEFDIMDMEAYAMAYVAKKFSVPFYSIKYITDNSDENVVQDWKANLKVASQKLFEIYKSL